MSRFCKTCAFMKGNREKLDARCHYWPHFAQTNPRPQVAMWQPTFAPSILSPRLVWDDLPTPSEMAEMGRDFSKEPLSETMDCPTWEAAL